MCGVVGVFANIGRAYTNWKLCVQGNLPNDLKDRGVDDLDALPNYHYRDDGLLYWAAIRKYVKTVVEGHYGKIIHRPKKKQKNKKRKEIKKIKHFW